MSILSGIVSLIGFDPMIASSRPTGYAMIYWVGLVIATATGGTLSWRWRSAAKTSVLLAAGLMLVASTCLLQIVTDQFMIRYVNAHIKPADTDREEVFVVAMPMPFLRSADFDRTFGVGSAGYKSATPEEYRRASLEPGNLLATYTTIFLHWSLLVVSMASLVFLLLASGLIRARRLGGRAP